MTMQLSSVLRPIARALMWIGCLAAVFSGRANGQAIGGLRGSVLDSTGAVVIGADVSVPGIPYRALTDERGVFLLNGLPVGTAVIVNVRRLGFVPALVPAVISDLQSAGASVRIEMKRIATVLPPVKVQRNRGGYTGRLAGYYERLEKKNAGYFISRDQIDRENPQSLSQLLLRAPGVSGFRGRGGLQGVRMRGRNCWPIVWIDGTPMPAGEADLDSFAPQTIHGIELYLGSTTAPTRFQLPRSTNSCGTILLWSRGPDTDPITASPQAARDLKAMLANMVVYRADQVDTQAMLADSGFSVVYPPALHAEGVRGSVIAEFVVNVSGRVEDGTFGIVASSNPLLSEAVRTAVKRALFIPARLKGVTVKQLIIQPFAFEP